MGLFNKIDGPIFLKEDTSATREISQLQQLREVAPPQIQEQIDRQIAIVNAGIEGEKNIDFELRNGHYPMVVIHDLYIKEGDLSAQIDYLIVTKGCTFFIECKNLVGTIEVDNHGEFTRTIQYGSKYYKEGIYSPVTQNQRHMDLMKQIRANRQNNSVIKFLVRNGFNRYNRSLVVLANAKAIIKDRYAPKDIRSKIIKADMLINTIRKENADLDSMDMSSEKMMIDSGNDYLSLNTENSTDYTQKFRKMIAEYHPAEINSEEKIRESSMDTCPQCGGTLILRKGKFGQFYGCSNYPKCRYTKKI